MNECKYAQVSNARIRYVDQGSGSAVVLLHGFPETLLGWRKNIPELSRHFRVVAPDLVGFGRSDKVDQDYSCLGLASFVDAFLEEIGVERAHIVGGDTGLLIALALAAGYPERVDKLVIFSGSSYPEGISALDVKAMMIPILGELVFLLFGRLALRIGIRRGFFDSKRIEPDIIEEYVDCLSSLKSRRLALRLMRELGQGSDQIMQLLRKNSPKSLILWAEHECYFYPWVPERLQQDLQGSTLEHIAGSGHFIQEELAEVFNKKVISFLANP